jgi:hypothetical protein
MKTAWVTIFTMAAIPMSGIAASANFRDYRDYLLAGTPQAAVIVDVNNDGIPDAVVGTFAGTAVLLGRGDGTLARPTMTGSSAVLSLVVADFNNDGNPDIAATILTNGTQVTLALGNGDGTFQTPQVLSVPCIDCFLAAADFNRDGKMDLALASTSSVTVVLGDGHGSFTGGLPTYVTSFTTAIATGDINRDGRPDLAVTDFGAGTIVVLLGNGEGAFTRSDYPSGTEPYQAVLADFNGDGLPDLAAPDRASNSVFVRLNQGGGVFGPSVTYPARCSPFESRTCTLEGLAAGDFNHDHKMDLATPGGILHGNGDGTFQATVPFYSGNVPLFVAAGDLNRDGFTDLLVGNSGSTNISVLLGNPQSVSQPPHLAAGNKPKAIATADFNGDGLADVAVAASADNVVHILLGAANGTFTPGTDLPVQQPGAVVAADLNGDGIMDLAIGSDYGTMIYLGRGDGTFTAGSQYAAIGDCTPTAFATTAAPCLVVADFNGDGILDLAGAVWINGTITILLGNGDGTFRTGSQTVVVSDTPQSLAAGDFNKDKKMDLAVSGFFGSVYVFPGKGDGTFGNAVTVKIGSTAAGLVVGDLDGDGNLDLVVAGGGESNSSVSLNVFVVPGNGDLTFKTPIALLADAEPNGVVLGDFNGDGLMDIASANFLADDVSVFINRGNMSFGAQTLYGTGGGPVALAAASHDILSVDQYSADVTVLVRGPK